jgi:hypothetical protein
MTDTTYPHLAERLAHLLAESSLDEKTKVVILQNLQTLSDDVLLELVTSLEQERVIMKDLTFAMKEFEKKQSIEWSALESQQEAAAHAAATATLKAIGTDTKIVDIRQKLSE